jgi:hypothetical protein
MELLVLSLICEVFLYEAVALKLLAEAHSLELLLKNKRTCSKTTDTLVIPIQPDGTPTVAGQMCKDRTIIVTNGFPGKGMARLIIIIKPDITKLLVTHQQMAHTPIMSVHTGLEIILTLSKHTGQIAEPLVAKPAPQTLRCFTASRFNDPTRINDSTL